MGLTKAAAQAIFQAVKYLIGQPQGTRVLQHGWDLVGDRPNPKKVFLMNSDIITSPESQGMI